MVNHALGDVIAQCAVVDVYLFEGIEGLSPGVAEEIFLDPVAETLFFNEEAVTVMFPNWDLRIEVAYRAGVTDPEALTAREALELALRRPLGPAAVVQTARQYAFTFRKEEADRVSEWASPIAALLHNSLIEVASWIARDGNTLRGSLAGDTATKKGNTFRFPSLYPHRVAPSPLEVRQFPLDRYTVAELEALSRERLLSLSREELEAIQAYYQDPEIRASRRRMGLTEEATDVELEMIAQTWSEHCKHKIFAAHIRYREADGRVEEIDSLFKTYIKETTRLVASGRPDLRSVFHDNSGVVDFDEEYLYCVKVETHNSPSALDPYGGAITGIVGVNRDILGTGLGARPLFNTNVLCFGYPETPASEVPPPLIHPRRVLKGVHRGIVDGGNQSGIPTVAGAFLFDESYVGKPLVFCGTGGILPRTVQGKPSWEKRIDPGDLAVMAGGRVGKDGIHGATFSSAALDETSPSSAVQIGDPITQKKLSDFLLEARDRGLYKALTDNGAGGLSSSLGEMAQLCGGVRIYLDRCPLKYPGLAPWEILLSESQERMSFAVGKDQIEEFLALAKRRGVEASVVGEFTDQGKVEVFLGNRLVGCLDLGFLHEGVPRMRLEAEWSPPPWAERKGFEAPEAPLGPDRVVLEGRAVIEERGKLRGRQEPTGGGEFLMELLMELLAEPNIASKESLVRQYDHEVQGGSIVKPFMGAGMDAPMDGGVIRPRYDSYRGLTITHGIKPRYGDYDTYAMAVAAVDEAYRSHIALGGDPYLVSALDNFCWPDPIPSPQNPDGPYKLAQLVRACKGLRDACLAYNLPLISGKDSMKNDAYVGNRKLSVRPTLLVTLVGIIKDVRRGVTADFKGEGDTVYLLGNTGKGLGGTFLEKVVGRETLRHWGLAYLPTFNPAEAFPLYLRLHEAMKQGLVASCHDVSDGGLAVALCESSLGGRLGVEVELGPELGRESLRGHGKGSAENQRAGEREEGKGGSGKGKLGAFEPPGPPHSSLTNFSPGLLEILFSEMPGRLVVSVKEKDRMSFEEMFAGYPCYRIGRVTPERELRFTWVGEQGRKKKRAPGKGTQNTENRESRDHASMNIYFPEEKIELFRVTLDAVEKQWKRFSIEQER